MHPTIPDAAEVLAWHLTPALRHASRGGRASYRSLLLLAALASQPSAGVHDAAGPLARTADSGGLRVSDGKGTRCLMRRRAANDVRIGHYAVGRRGSSHPRFSEPNTPGQSRQSSGRHCNTYCSQSGQRPASDARIGQQAWDLGQQLRTCPHRAQASCARRCMRFQVGVRSEEHQPRQRPLWSSGMPGEELLGPAGPALIPGDQHERDRVGRRELARVVEAADLDASSSARIGDAGCDDQVASDDGDRHSARAGSASRGWTGCGWTPFDPFIGIPSIT